MNRSSALSTPRRWAASTALLTSSAAWVAAALWLNRIRPPGVAPWWMMWSVVVAALLAVASVGIVRRSLLSQTFSRGIALWVVALALPYWSGVGWLGLRLVTAAVAFAALRLSAPGLDTEEARAEFAPVAYRKLFLAGATAAAGLGVSSALLALWSAAAMASGHATGAPGEVWGPALLAIPCLLSAIGVVRMRAWGVILGAATGVGSIACALPVLGQVNALGLAYVCVPALLLAAPLVLSRLAGSGREAGSRSPAERELRIEVARRPEHVVDKELEDCDDEGHATEAAGRVAL